MQDPNRLLVTEKATILAVAVYRLTGLFPPGQQFGVTAQMQRAAVSIGSNIAEGCGRRGDRELLHFLYVASGSARSSRSSFVWRRSSAMGPRPTATWCMNISTTCNAC